LTDDRVGYTRVSVLTTAMLALVAFLTGCVSAGETSAPTERPVEPEAVATTVPEPAPEERSTANDELPDVPIVASVSAPDLPVVARLPLPVPIHPDVSLAAAAPVADPAAADVTGFVLAAPGVSEVAPPVLQVEPERPESGAPRSEAGSPDPGTTAAQALPETPRPERSRPERPERPRPPSVSAGEDTSAPGAGSVGAGGGPATVASDSRGAARASTQRVELTSPADQETESERSIQPGARFAVTLSGPSWIFLGTAHDGEPDPEPAGVEFLDRRSEDGSVEFAFRRTVENGAVRPVTLRFEAQDLATGARRVHREVLRAPEGNSEVVVARGAAAEDGAGSGQAGQAAPAAAGTQNATTASSGDTSRSVDATIEALSSSGALPPGTRVTDLLDRADALVADGRLDDAVRLLETMRTTGVGSGDEVIFRLAQVLESEWAGRDLRRARDLYRTLVADYPLSDHWRASGARIEYLNRHFFFIR